MFKSQKHVFWQALLVTIIIFGVGVIAGVIIENLRTSKISLLSQESEIDLLDIRLQNEIYSGESFNCESAIKENLNFAEKVFQEAKVLDKYERASRLIDSLKVQHKKYDILRAMLLINSNQIKEKCNADYYEVVYFYQYNEPSFETKAKQNVFSKVLEELKEKKGADVLLIPMAGDNNLASINLILAKYGISRSELPIILINGEIKINNIMNVEDLERVLDNKEDENVIRL